MKTLVVFIGLVLVACVLVQAAAVGGSWWLHRQGRLEDEIAWLEGFRPFLSWERGLDAQIDKLYRDRIRIELGGEGVDRALHALRLARARAKARGVTPDPELMALGIETYTHAADRLEAHGRLSLAADWDDSLFVFAIRAAEPRHRYAALAAFLEGLDLRVRDGQPCAALARLTWAKRGLGGDVPGLQPSVEQDLATQCRHAPLARRSR